MNITVIGPGAMGMLFGGLLSQNNSVTLIGRDPVKMEHIREQGLLIRDVDGTENIYHPDAVTSSKNIPVQDLVIVFVKSADTQTALSAHSGIIGENTILMTLQNGAGHEPDLLQFVRPGQAAVGVTMQGSYILSDRAVCHSGGGDSFIGAVEGDPSRFAAIAAALTESGLPCHLSDSVRQMVWNKLMINASSSVLSGILQVAQGYVIKDASAWKLAQALIRELCAVATADGYSFDPDAQIDRLYHHLEAAPGGFTSIYADLKNGRRTEVDYINGFVVRTGKKYDIPTPTHELIVDLVHAMENR
ncbi:MAG: 2-dehydropantoate 2-reductase [Firmicutes bacterium]|nr:2-dehydropantoate 2-reductase [Bacillota bacterium]